MTHEQSLHTHLISLKLSDCAINWLLIVWRMMQTFDDFADHDEVTRDRLDTLIFDSFVSYASHPFYLAHYQQLTPICANVFFKWKASDTAERSGIVSEVSFVWRAAFYDLIIAVMFIELGREYTTENSHLIMSLYGEKYSDYVGEFNHA